MHYQIYSILFSLIHSSFQSFECIVFHFPLPLLTRSLLLRACDIENVKKKERKEEKMARVVRIWLLLIITASLRM